MEAKSEGCCLADFEDGAKECSGLLKLKKVRKQILA